MKRVIVTGANGFVGGALVQELLKKNAEVWAVDLDGCKNNIPSAAHFVACDLSEISSLCYKIPERGFDAFFHLAWAGSAGEKRFDTYLQLNNAQWTVHALRTAKELDCGRFVCAGSIMEDEVTALLSSEEARPGLGYIYGSGKLVSHSMALSVASSIGIDIVWAKITNAYGVGEVSPRFINTTIRKIICGEPLQFTAGTQNYDFVYIHDVARAFYLMGVHGKPFHQYVVGSGNAKPLREFILEMKGALAPDMEFIFGDLPFTGVNMPLEAFDGSPLRNDTGFAPETSFAEGVKQTMQWLVEMEKNA